jgi:hypothetical protein
MSRGLHWVVEPWPEPVDGDALIRDIIRRLRRHVVKTVHQSTAVALWVLFAIARRIKMDIYRSPPPPRNG